MDPDEISRIIMLLYGRMDHGGPFWSYVAIKPSRFDEFRAAERAGEIDLHNFDAFGEVIVSAEGEQPPDEITEKVAELYGADASTFFQPIDPIAAIHKKIEEMDEPDERDEPSDQPPLPASSWAARVGRRGAK